MGPEGLTALEKQNTVRLPFQTTDGPTSQIRLCI